MEAVASRPDPFVTVSQLADQFFTNVTHVLRGKPEQSRLAIATMLAGGHLLIEDVPGVGKTLLAKALARSIGGTYRRIQGTPDLLPADLTGVSVYRRSSETWEFRPGPLFANVVLMDEINRATPRTQAALLESMEERQISIDGETRPLPSPFFLVATQNPFEHAGTFPLVEGQRDRFATVLELGLPDRASEREILTGTGGATVLDQLRPVTRAENIGKAIAVTNHVHVSASIADYVLDIAEASRRHPEVTLGASPRASLALLSLVRGYAVVLGNQFVTPDHVKACAPAALSHRLILAGGPDLAAASVVVDEILESVPPPRG